ncbi:hypothetical protein SNE510_40610 [Streptomyces sp. NE5-10]|nr:hypothetical protein SNE510_40610 [Streptomyces sp. NE5-10]
MLDRDADPRAAFAAYERERRAPVTRTREWAEPGMRWWEALGRRLHTAPAQFGPHFMTRTSALTYEGLRRRFADRVDEAEEAYRTASATTGSPRGSRSRGAPRRLHGRGRPGGRRVPVARRAVRRGDRGAGGRGPLRPVRPRLGDQLAPDPPGTTPEAPSAG